MAVFSFTYGLHLGKKIQPPAPVMHSSTETPLAESAPDAIPNRQEVDSQSKEVEEAADESIQQALRDEVSRTGIKLNQPKPIQLPTQTQSEKKGKAAEGKFTLQVASYPTQEEAKARVADLSKKGLKAFLQVGAVSGKGKVFRVLTGGFGSKAEAEEYGKTLVIHDTIESFVVVSSHP